MMLKLVYKVVIITLFSGPEVLLSSQLLDFGMVYSEKEVTKTLDITNNSKCVAVFQVRTLLAVSNTVPIDEF